MTTAFGRLAIDLNREIEPLIMYLEKRIKKGRPDLFPSFVDGYKFKIFGKFFEKMKHIRRLKKVTDFVLVANPPPVIEPEPSVEED